MSRVKAPPVRDTLLVVVGARRIDYGVLIAGRCSWRHGSVGGYPIQEDEQFSAPMEALAAALEAMPPAPGAARLRVIVSDTWLAAVTVPWSSGMQHQDGAQALARSQLAHAGYIAAPGDTIRLDDAPFRAPRLAVAYPAALVDALARAATRLDVRLDSVLSLAAASWTFAHRQQKGKLVVLALYQPGSIAVAHHSGIGRARLSELKVRASDPAEGADLRAIHALWRRLCLRDPQLAGVGEVPLLDLSPEHPARDPGKPFAPIALPSPRPAEGAAPLLRLAAESARRRSALDAFDGGPVLSGARALLLAAATLLAGAALLHAAQAASDAAAARAAGAAPPEVKVRAPAVGWSKAELARIPAVNAAIRELNLPLAAILRALEPPPDLRVAVLAVTTAARAYGAHTSSVKIVAEARSAAEMARYVAFVAARKPFGVAYLTEHEIDEAVAEKPYRFTLEASWND